MVNASSTNAAAVLWEKDDEVSECPICNKKFNSFLRRHHCRACGKILCGACCPFVKKDGKKVRNCCQCTVKESNSSTTAATTTKRSQKEDKKSKPPSRDLLFEDSELDDHFGSIALNGEAQDVESKSDDLETEDDRFSFRKFFGAKQQEASVPSPQPNNTSEKSLPPVERDNYYDRLSAAYGAQYAVAPTTSTTIISKSDTNFDDSNLLFNDHHHHKSLSSSVAVVAPVPTYSYGSSYDAQQHPVPNINHNIMMGEEEDPILALNSPKSLLPAAAASVSGTNTTSSYSSYYDQAISSTESTAAAAANAISSTRKDRANTFDDLFEDRPVKSKRDTVQPPFRGSISSSTIGPISNTTDIVHRSSLYEDDDDVNEAIVGKITSLEGELASLKDLIKSKKAKRNSRVGGGLFTEETSLQQSAYDSLFQESSVTKRKKSTRKKTRGDEFEKEELLEESKPVLLPARNSLYASEEEEELLPLKSSLAKKPVKDFIDDLFEDSESAATADLYGGDSSAIPSASENKTERTKEYNDDNAVISEEEELPSLKGRKKKVSKEKHVDEETEPLMDVPGGGNDDGVINSSEADGSNVEYVVVEQQKEILSVEEDSTILEEQPKSLSVKEEAILVEEPLMPLEEESPRVENAVKAHVLPVPVSVSKEEIIYDEEDLVFTSNVSDIYGEEDQEEKVTADIVMETKEEGKQQEEEDILLVKTPKSKKPVTDSVIPVKSEAKQEDDENECIEFTSQKQRESVVIAEDNDDENNLLGTITNDAQYDKDWQQMQSDEAARRSRVLAKKRRAAQKNNKKHSSSRRKEPKDGAAPSSSKKKSKRKSSKDSSIDKKKYEHPPSTALNVIEATTKQEVVLLPPPASPVVQNSKDTLVDKPKSTSVLVAPPSLTSSHVIQESSSSVEEPKTSPIQAEVLPTPPVTPPAVPVKSIEKPEQVPQMASPVKQESNVGNLAKLLAAQSIPMGMAAVKIPTFKSSAPATTTNVQEEQKEVSTPAKDGHAVMTRPIRKKRRPPTIRK